MQNDLEITQHNYNYHFLKGMERETLSNLKIFLTTHCFPRSTARHPGDHAMNPGGTAMSWDVGLGERKERGCLRCSLMCTCVLALVHTERGEGDARVVDALTT